MIIKISEFRKIFENTNTVTNLVHGLSDSDEIRPLRMKAPSADERHEYMLFNYKNSRGGGLYIQDQLEDMLIDKYGTERGKKAFQGILQTKGNAFFAYGDKIAREKSHMINDLISKGHKNINYSTAFIDYFSVSYFALWKLWMEENGFKYVIPTADDIQARKDEIEAKRLVEEEKIKQDKKDAELKNFNNELENLKAKYPGFDKIQPDSKDIERINTLFKNNDINNSHKMANSIKDKNKAIRRGNAIVNYLLNNKQESFYLRYANIFYRRALEL